MTSIQGHVTLRLDGIERHFQRAQKALSVQTLQKVMTESGREIGAEIERIVVNEYPLPPRRPLDRVYTRVNKKGEPYLSKFKSAKQQGYVFKVLIPSGKIKYRRTGMLGRSITSAVVVSADATRVTVKAGTNLPYAKYVIGEQQYYYHAVTGWKQIQAQINAKRDALKARFQTTFKGLIVKEF